MSLNRWNWLDDGVLPLTLVIMRVCWLAPWLAFMERWLVAPHLEVISAPILVFGLLVAGFATARMALRFPLIQARLSVAMLGLLTVFLALWSLFYRVSYALWDSHWLGKWATATVTWTDWGTLGVPAALFGFLAFAFLWLRGVLEGGRLSLAREQVWGTFAAGFVALAILFLMAHLDPQGLPNGAGNLLWFFFATGMAALALTGLRESGALEGSEPGPRASTENRLRFDRYWLASVLTVIVSVLVIGFALSILIAPEVASSVLGAGWVLVRELILYLWLFLSVLLYPLVFLLARLFKPLSERLGVFQIEMRLQVADSFDPKELVGQEPGRAIAQLPDELRWVALVALVLAVGLVFAFVLRRLATWARKSDVEEIRESVVSRDLLQSQLSELWRNLQGRFSRRAVVKARPFLSLAGEVDTRRSIREVYQALLLAAQAQGQSRSPSQTPHEFGPRLTESWATESEALAAITEGYVQARYAPAAPTPEQVHRVQQAWQRLRSEIHSLSEHPVESE